jgi:nicotinamidase-related amidase
VTTSGCVRATVIDGFSYNYRVVVPHEAVYDRSQVSHAVNLFDMAAKYADVMSVNELQVELAKIA